MLIFKCSFHDIQAQFQLCFVRSFDFHKSSLTISYPIGHAQLAIIETKTKKRKKNKIKTILEKKKIRITKTSKKKNLKIETNNKKKQLKVSKRKEKSPYL